MRLTSAELRTVIAALQDKYGAGYNSPAGALLAKLSVMLEVQTRIEGKVV